jgi:hypothetical protein
MAKLDLTNHLLCPRSHVSLSNISIASLNQCTQTKHTLINKAEAMLIATLADQKEQIKPSHPPCFSQTSIT